MTVPRTNYPKQGLPQPPGVHIESVPILGERNRELEGLINAVDGGTDLRVVLAPGGGPWFATEFAALLSAVTNRGVDTADQVRAARSAIESLLYEMQHPKQVLYEGPDVVVDANGEYVSPWIDTVLWRWIGYYIANVGAAVVTTVVIYWSENPAGAGPFISYGAPAAAIAAGATWYSQDCAIVAGGWIPTSSSVLAARYVRLMVQSAQGTTIQTKIVGMR